MLRKQGKKARQISVEELATVAAVGVARALEARQAAGVAVSAAELAEVNGGALLLRGTIMGGNLLPMFNHMGQVGMQDTLGQSMTQGFVIG
jgi:hypothetical protein